jgi:hypothetical protein
MNRRGLAGRVAAAARQANLFLLIHRASWEFLSCRTGKRIAIWHEHTGQILDAASHRIGRSRSPYGALNLAVRLDRETRGVVASHRAAGGGPRRTGPPDGTLEGTDAAAGLPGAGNGEGGKP